MINVAKEFKKYCQSQKVVHFINDDITPPDSSTLFISAGMQKFKDWSRNPNIKTTLATNQTCIRVNDLKAVGDGIHLAVFHMLGLFSLEIGRYKKQ